MNSIILKAPAKINYGLRVLSKREDGYHNLETIFYPILDLYDEITISTSGGFEFECNSNLTGDDQDNIIIKAKEKLEELIRTKINVRIELKKVIPVGAGLGGGSSDAAAVLMGLNELLQLNLDFSALSTIALELGSDVPFFLYGKPAIGRSRGEILEAIDFKITYPILLVYPNIHISTKEAFQNHVLQSGQKKSLSQSDFNPIDFSYHRLHIINDFEQEILKKYPVISDIKDLLYRKGALFSLMSGTGSTVYGIFNNVDEALMAEKSLNENYFVFLSNPGAVH